MKQQQKKLIKAVTNGVNDSMHIIIEQPSVAILHEGVNVENEDSSPSPKS